MLESSDVDIDVHYVPPSPELGRVDCDGSIASKPISSKLAAAFEQLAEEVTVAEKSSRYPELVKEWLAQTLTTLIFNEVWGEGCAERRLPVRFECRVAAVKKLKSHCEAGTVGIFYLLVTDWLIGGQAILTL